MEQHEYQSRVRRKLLSLVMLLVVVGVLLTPAKAVACPYGSNYMQCWNVCDLYRSWGDAACYAQFQGQELADCLWSIEYQWSECYVNCWYSCPDPEV
jgi:hypothetical protein